MPRPETEQAVDHVIAALPATDRPLIVDLCTGSGALALAVADELERRAIPFAFATGYSPDDVLPPERAAVPVLTKPYSAAEVRSVLDTLRMACAGGRKAAGA